MSGHSKWATIRRKKEKADSARGRVFTRLIKEIVVAARIGGGDENGNARLRQAISAARAANMPQSNIERAVKRGTGELPGVVYEEVTYEGYAPGGVALMINVLTDNKNRTVSEIRHIFSRRGGNLAESGAVSYLFERKGVITVNAKGLSEDNIMEIALEAGADDIKSDDGIFEIYTAPNEFESVRAVVAKNPVEIVSAEISMIPFAYVRVEGENAKKLLKLLEDIEEHDDVQNIYGNFDIDEKVLEEQDLP
jgi:YebC/PmpR family DNA-binding regulatory protein